MPLSNTIGRRLAVLVLAQFLCALIRVASAHQSTLPPVPVPAENPVTEEKRILGKILFWDEQLSSDNTVACGTCHRPAAGGADPRVAVHPGRDGIVGTEDDVFGSPGIRRLDHNGMPVPDGPQSPQTTDRAAPPYFMSLWAESVFWDGRAGSEFHDPLTNRVLIAKGGALENQALGPLLNPAEMANAGRNWTDVMGKLERSLPLALATNLPADVSLALAQRPDYPSLFDRAFGDPAITPARIAFAIATYERTLVADQTPWDLAMAGVTETTPAMRQGQTWFEHHQCVACHVPPLFTNNDFINAGVRPAFMDHGRKRWSGDNEDDGDMKVPSLRNTGLRATFMHSGSLRTLDEVLDMYANPKAPPDPLPTTGERYVVRMTEQARALIKEFLIVGLTDPRVAAEKFPFDRPVLRSERNPEDRTPPTQPIDFIAERTTTGIRLHWNAADTGIADYILERNGKVIALPTGTEFIDATPKPGIYRYRLIARDTAANASTPTVAWLWPVGLRLGLLICFCAGALWLVIRVKRAARRARALPANP